MSADNEGCARRQAHDICNCLNRLRRRPRRLDVRRRDLVAQEVRPRGADRARQCACREGHAYIRDCGLGSIDGQCRRGRLLRVRERTACPPRRYVACGGESGLRFERRSQGHRVRPRPEPFAARRTPSCRQRHVWTAKRPPSPSGMHQEATTQTAVVLAWDASTDNVGVVSYGIYDAGGIPIDSVTPPSATLSGLACGRTFRFDVDAADAAGNRSRRGTAWVATAECSDGQPPTAPTGLAVTSRTATGLTVSWSSSYDNVGVAGYRVSLGSAYSTDVTGTSAGLSGLACNTTYTVRVDAYDSAGNRSSASTTSATTEVCAPSAPPPTTPPPAGDTSPPSQPSNLGVAATTPVSVSLKWTPSQDDVGVTGYQVYMDGAPVQTTGRPDTTVAGLACGRGHTFAVDAYDSAGNHSYALPSSRRLQPVRTHRRRRRPQTSSHRRVRRTASRFPGLHPPTTVA